MRSKCDRCSYCEARGANRYCTLHDAYIGWMGCENCNPTPYTHFDSIRNMTVEEMAEMFLEHDEHFYRHCPTDEIADKCRENASVQSLNCKQCWLDYLKQR